MLLSKLLKIDEYPTCVFYESVIRETEVKVIVMRISSAILLTVLLLSSCMKEEIQFTTLVKPKLDHISSETLDEDSSVVIDLTAIDLNSTVGEAQWETDNRLEMAQRIIYKISEDPAHGKIVDCEWDSTPLNCTYIPSPDYYGNDSFSYVVADGPLNSEPGVISLTVINVPDLPVAKNSSYNILAGSSMRITFVGYDADGPQDDIYYERTNGPSKGAISDCQQNGNIYSCLFSTQVGEHSQQLLNFVVSEKKVEVGDEFDPSAEGTVTINIIKGANYPPVGVAQTEVGAEDTALSITVTQGTDLDPADQLSYQIISTPLSADSFSCSGTTELTCSYMPKTNFYGEDYFTYIVSDGINSSAVIKVTLQITPVNDAPVAYEQTVQVEENVEKLFSASGSDIDGDALQYEMVSATPQYGIVTNCFVGGSKECSYTSNSGSVVADIITYRVFDGSLYSEIKTISFVIAGVNEAPVAPANSQEVVTEDTTLTFSLPTGTDPDGDTLSYVITAMPSSSKFLITGCFIGQLYSSGQSCDIKILSEFPESASLEFKAFDGELYSDIANINFTNALVNDAPTKPTDLTVTIKEGQVKSFALPPSTDAEGELLKYIITALPATDSFLITGCELAVAYDSGKLCTVETTGEISTLGYLEFHAFDRTDISETAKVNLIGEAVNNAPGVPDQQTINLDEDSAELSFDVTASVDIDNSAEELTYVLVAPPTHGALASDCFSGMGNRTCKYKVNVNFYGQDYFVYQVSDGMVSSENITVILNVSGVNDRPSTPGNLTLVVPEGRIEYFRLPSSIDIDSTNLEYEITSIPNPTIFKLTGCEFGMKYEVSHQCQVETVSEYFGTGSLLFRACDSDGLCSETGIISMVNSLTNDGPVAPAAQVIGLYEDDPELSFSVSAAVDVDSSPETLIYSLVSWPSHGSLSADCLEGVGNRNCKYIVNANFSGDDSFSYKVSDGSLETGYIRVVMRVNPSNDLPILGAPQTVFTQNNIPKSFILNQAIDIDSLTLSYVLVTAPTHGSLSGCATAIGSTSRDCTYTPATDYIGADFFRYQVSDGIGLSEVMRVEILVEEQDRIWKYRYETKYVTGEDVAQVIEIIIVVDDSGSMGNNAVNLAQSIPGLINELQGKNVNIRVYTTDNSSTTLPVSTVFQMRDDMTQSSLDSVSTAVSAEILGVGLAGSGNEQGLCTVYRVLDELHIPKDSIGGIVIISDENDHTSSVCPKAGGGGYSYTTTQGSYEGLFIDKANNFFQDYFVEMIAGDSTQSCSIGELGARYSNVINGVNLNSSIPLTVPEGHFTSICESDYSTSFRNMSDYLIHIRTRLFEVIFDEHNRDEILYAVRVRRQVALSATTASVMEFATFLETQSIGGVYNPLNDSSLIVPRIGADYTINSDGNVLFTRDFLEDNDEVLLIYRFWEYDSQ